MQGWLQTVAVGLLFGYETAEFDVKPAGGKLHIEI